MEVRHTASGLLAVLTWLSQYFCTSCSTSDTPNLLACVCTVPDRKRWKAVLSVQPSCYFFLNGTDEYIAVGAGFFFSGHGFSWGPPSEVTPMAAADHWTPLTAKVMGPCDSPAFPYTPSSPGTLSPTVWKFFLGLSSWLSTTRINYLTARGLRVLFTNGTHN